MCYLRCTDTRSAARTAARSPRSVEPVEQIFVAHGLLSVEGRKGLVDETDQRMGLLGPFQESVRTLTRAIFATSPTVYAMTPMLCSLTRREGQGKMRRHGDDPCLPTGGAALRLIARYIPLGTDTRSFVMITLSSFVPSSR
jgi:hypothetical protein